MRLWNSCGLLGSTFHRLPYNLSNHRKGKKNRNLELHVYPVKRYLKWYFRRHGETVSDDRLFLCGATFPAVQLNAAAAWQKNLLVHLHWRVPGKLASCTPQRNKQHLRLHRSPKYYVMCIHVSRACHEKKCNCGANLIPLLPLGNQLPPRISSKLHRNMLGIVSKWEADVCSHFRRQHSFHCSNLRAIDDDGNTSPRRTKMNRTLSPCHKNNQGCLPHCFIL